jgi:cobalt/nickel transport protein
MKRTLAVVLAGIAGVGLLAGVGRSHFQVLMPERDIVAPADEKAVGFDILFSHPMEQGPVMDMGSPAAFGVLVGGRRHDLTDTLEKVAVDGKSAYQSSYEIRRPGDHVFYLEPAPYWEPAEGKMIVHYTKVVLDGLHAGEGWDALVGLPVEIEPLVRPYGLWAGNVFRGIVRKDGQPVPFAEIEVEYWNAGGRVGVPSEPFVTQVIKADGNGAFCYAMPRAGWWSFAALVEADETMANPDGEQVPVELGGLIWVHAVDMR